LYSIIKEKANSSVTFDGSVLRGRRLSCEAGKGFYPAVGGAGEGGAGEGAALPLLPAPRGVRHAFLPRHAVGPEAGHAQHPALGPNLVASLTESHTL
jgi:hypothetical protein